jgi:hypothetical protein
MVRRFGFPLVVLATLAGMGCSQDGAVDVTWTFVGNEPASSGCGQHGIDSVVVSGLDSGNNVVRLATLCTPGAARVEVAPGDWTIQVSIFDFQGHAANPEVPDPTQKVVVTTNAPAAVNVVLTPPPPCRDGVDNDGDGRVDTADPDCVNGTE